MSDESKLLQCYNRGCGQKFNQNENTDTSCRHHPGQPIFHDAYKGWSCCNKKCTDFTEFLNIKGCTLSKHSNEKPPEVEKPKATNIPDTEVIEVKPIVPSALQRPPFDTPLTIMKAEIAPSLKQQLSTLQNCTNLKETLEESSKIEIGTSCKNGGCNATYQGEDSNESICLYHPGVPVFHEGLKFWSCCQKRTTDFNAFLNQIGCENGKHVWIKKESNSETIQCRWDYHQTGSHVVVSIYAKQYCPVKSEVKLNPIRLFVNLVFPQQGNANFNLDLELRGIIDIKASQVTMFGTKVEVKLKKAEPGTWVQLEIPRKTSEKKKNNSDKVDDITPQVDAVDLSDL